MREEEAAARLAEAEDDDNSEGNEGATEGVTEGTTDNDGQC